MLRWTSLTWCWARSTGRLQLWVPVTYLAVWELTRILLHSCVTWVPSNMVWSLSLALTTLWWLLHIVAHRADPRYLVSAYSCMTLYGMACTVGLSHPACGLRPSIGRLHAQRWRATRDCYGLLCTLNEHGTMLVAGFWSPSGCVPCTRWRTWRSVCTRIRT